jgi:uncharacterized coiled-coil DUF342 family protein
MNQIEKEISILKEILEDSVLTIGERIAIRQEIAQLKEVLPS